MPEPLFYKVHCLKSVQIWNFFWFVFSQILSENVEIRAIKNSVFRHFPYSGCRPQPGTFLKKRLRFTLSLGKFLRIPFLRNTTVPLLLQILKNFQKLLSKLIWYNGFCRLSLPSNTLRKHSKHLISTENVVWYTLSHFTPASQCI